MAAGVVIGDRREIEQALVSDFLSAAAAAVAARGAFMVVLSGGSIGPLLFPALAQAPVDWSRVDFFWTDERAVPPDHADSNFAEANRLWLQPAGIPPFRIHRMPGENPDLRIAAEAYSAELVRVAGNPPALDFALLGCGSDGHVASLFPGHPASRADRDLVVAIEDAPKPPPRRLTLTMPVLAAAVQIVVAGIAVEKADMINRALKPGSTLPLGVLMTKARNVRVLLVK